MDGNRHFDLFSTGKSTKVRVDQPPPDGIDLTGLKNHVVYSLTRNIEREDRIHTGVRTKDRRKFLQFRDSRYRFRAAAVNDDRDFPFGTQPAVYVLTAGLTLFSFYYNFFCHNFL